MNPRKRLRQYRKDRKLSVAQMAELVGCSTQFIYALEDGAEGKLPGRINGHRIQAITGITNDDWTELARTELRKKTA